MGKYRKKPVVIEAIRWMTDNYAEVEAFFGDLTSGTEMWPDENGSDLIINTLEGEMRCKPFDWIIKGVKDECYPCKPDIFEATYEPVQPQGE